MAYAWVPRVHGLAFAASVAIAAVMQREAQFSFALFLAAVGAALVVLGSLTRLPVPLPPAVLLAAAAIVTDGVGAAIFRGGRPAADVVQSLVVWPDCLVLFMGARLLALFSRDAVERRRLHPLDGPAVAAEQSFLAAGLAGAGLAILAFDLVPAADAAPVFTVGGVFTAAMRGSTSIHVAIVLLAATCLVLLTGGFLRCWEDRLAIVRLRRRARAELPVSTTTVADWLLTAAGPFRASRAVELLRGFLVAPDGDYRSEADAALGEAARLFLRRLLGLLPLLGFLGTVVGLAAAIAALPRDLAAAGDLTSSLGGLAIKFETTFLGLLAHLVGSLLVNLLERVEAEERAGLLQLAAVIHDAAV